MEIIKVMLLVSALAGLGAFLLAGLVILGFKLGDLVRVLANRGRGALDPDYMEWPGFLAYFVFVVGGLPVVVACIYGLAVLAFGPDQ